MRSYGDLVEVQRGSVGTAGLDVPAQFMWRDKLWVVRDVISHWIETGAWWEQAGVAAALYGVSAASAEQSSSARVDTLPERLSDADLLAEREFWRVEAATGRMSRLVGGAGVFDLAFDWSDGRWRLVRCID